MLATLAPLRTKIAESPSLSRGYNAVKSCGLQEEKRMREESKRLRVLWLCNICPSFGGCRAGAQLQRQGRVADRGIEPLSGG